MTTGRTRVEGTPVSLACLARATPELFLETGGRSLGAKDAKGGARFDELDTLATGVSELGREGWGWLETDARCSHRCFNEETPPPPPPPPSSVSPVPDSTRSGGAILHAKCRVVLSQIQSKARV